MSSEPKLGEDQAKARAIDSSQLSEQLRQHDAKIAQVELDQIAQDDSDNDTSFIRAQKRKAKGLESEFQCQLCSKYYATS